MTPDAFREALKPYGYDWVISITGISGSGSWIVVFATAGDFLTACITYDYQVVWVMTCGGQEVDANTDEVNHLNFKAREMYRMR